jgi:dolichol-phosphate mannosyltransferase
MLKGKKIIVIAAAYNEEGKIGKAVQKTKKLAKFVDRIVVVNDCSRDNTAEEAKSAGAIVINHKTNKGAGAAYRTGFYYGLKKGYDIIVEIAGDDQDDPAYIKSLVKPIIEENYDYVQGSRYKEGKIKQPLFRLFTTTAYSLFFTICAGKRFTDATTGFRAFKAKILNDFDLNQAWLNHYELEPYFFLKVVRGGYKVKEVFAPKYFPAEKSYSKMTPFRSWWSILRPLILVSLRIKK